MIEVTMTEIGVDNPRADCLMAALASILEVSIDSLPNVYDLDKDGVPWWASVQRALVPHRLVPVFYSQNSDQFGAIAPKGYHVAIGATPRTPDIPHACVALDGRIIFDPHPSRAGIVGPITDWIILVPAAPAV